MLRHIDIVVRWVARTDRLVAAACACALVLVMPLCGLLFLQWPLRDLLHRYSREANDIAQCLFALYVAIAITYATRRRAHLAADALSRRYSPAVRARLARLSALLVLLPWSLFLLYATAPMLWQSLLQLERFPETYNPGYFLLKIGVVLLAALVFVQAIVDALRA